MASANLLKLIDQWLAEARTSFPAALNRDGSGVMIYGDVGGAAYIRSDGSVELEAWDDYPGNSWLSEPLGVRYAILTIAAKKRPALVELLPLRPAAADDCVKCGQTGWRKIGPLEVACEVCHGLGWISPPNNSLELTRGS